SPRPAFTRTPWNFAIACAVDSRLTLPLPSSALNTRLSAPHSGAASPGASPSERILLPAALASRCQPGAQRPPAAPAGCSMLGDTPAATASARLLLGVHTPVIRLPRLLALR
ncbi:Hypothetical predicted protein, partial [Marmota monax]